VAFDFYHLGTDKRETEHIALRWDFTHLAVNLVVPCCVARCQELDRYV